MNLKKELLWGLWVVRALKATLGFRFGPGFKAPIGFLAFWESPLPNLLRVQP